jgi:hypothetical protein
LNNEFKEKNIMSSNDASINPIDDRGSKSVGSHHAPSTSGHEEAGAEKFFSSGGSGEVLIRTG